MADDMMTDEEYSAQGSKKMAVYAAAVKTIVDSLPEPRRALVKGMLAGPVGEQFMLAPASTRRRFHNAFPGGLVAHSLGVVGWALRLAETLAPGRWPTSKVAFCALFHDLGKAGSPDIPYYVPTKDLWKFNRGEFYEINRSEFQPNAEKALYVLQLHGIVLDHEETVAIRLNDGPGAEGNRDYAFHEPDLALVIHWADFWQTNQEKNADKH